MDDFRQAVAERRDAALRRMTEAVGSVGLCTLARSGTPVPAVKYDEGAAAVLGDVLRGLAAQPARDPASVLADVAERWAAAPAHRLAGRNRDWAAYATGGQDALDSLRDLLPGPQEG